MDFNDAAKIIVQFIRRIKKTDSKPGISYIINKVLSLPVLNTLLTSNFTTKEILQIGYMVFFIFEGDDYASAEWKSKNDLYLLDVDEVDDLDYIDITCEDCDGSGEMTCNICDGDRQIVCDNCDGEGIFDGVECEECYGTGYIDCEDCDGSGEIVCDSCDGNREVQSADQYVFFNGEMWVIGNPETARKLEEIYKIGELTDDLYDILDEDKGSIFLVKTHYQTKEMELSDFEQRYGDFYDLHGHYEINSIINLKDSKYNFLIDNRSKNNITIR